jgi:hypothetical protein
MQCELMECCQFFNDNMKNLPIAAEYVKSKLCLGDFESCSRFRIFKEYGGEKVISYVDQGDAEQVNKAIRCLRKKQECKKQ